MAPQTTHQDEGHSAYEGRGVTIFHNPVRRTFHRKAKAGRVKIAGACYQVASPAGEPFRGEVTIHLALAGNTAWVKGNPMERLEINEV